MKVRRTHNVVVDEGEITLPVESHARRTALFKDAFTAFSPSITRLPTGMLERDLQNRWFAQGVRPDLNRYCGFI